MDKMYLSRIKAEELLFSDTLSTDWLIQQGKKNKKNEELRLELIKISNIVKMKLFNWTGGVLSPSKIRTYKYDLAFGLELYDLLTNNEKFKISLRTATNIEFWSYLSVLIIPDIVSERYDFSNKERFYLTSNRVWLSTLWWYIHLSWQGDKESTREILKGNSTDTIMNLVDRVGQKGYNVDLYRTIMKEYLLISHIKQSSSDRDYFRSIMITNNFLTQTIEPGLYQEGTQSYVENIFSICGFEKTDGLYNLKKER